MAENQNITTTSGHFELRVFKNGTLFNTISLPVADEKIISKKVSF